MEERRSLGQNNITIKWDRKNKNGNYKIYTGNSIYESSAYNDTLRISGIKSSAFNFKYKDSTSTLVMSNSKGSISVNVPLLSGFAKGIKFDDRTLSMAAIINRAKS